MNKKNISRIMGACLLSCGLAATLTGCKNGSADFPDFEGGTTAYFAYQYPVRTIVLGDDDYDTTLDKAHQCQIKATFGGSYSGSNGTVQVAVDPTLVDGLTFEDGTPVKAMPESYYSLSTTNLAFNGTFNGTTTVQLTDAFFADPDAVKNTYVIPLVMTGQTGFGKILAGELNEGASPVRQDASQWAVQPKDFVLYCVKFQNKYSGFWLTNGNTSTENIEKAGNVEIRTKSLNTCTYTVSYQRKYQARTYDENGNEVPKWEDRIFSTTLLLTFNDNNQCTITSLTDGITATGNGSWTDDGAKKSWNNKDRDLMELNYSIPNFGVDDYGNTVEGANTHEMMVWFRSGVSLTGASKEFSPIYTK